MSLIIEPGTQTDYGGPTIRIRIEAYPAVEPRNVNFAKPAWVRKVRRPSGGMTKLGAILLTCLFIGMVYGGLIYWMRDR